MIVRVQSREGTRRITASPSLSFQQFLELVVREFQLSKNKEFSLFRSHGRQDELTQSHLSMTLESIPIRHGDMLYLADGQQAEKSLTEATPTTATPMSATPTSTVTEDEVDVLLATKDGKIYREKDPQLCHHSGHSKCLNCAPLEPWDRKVLESRSPPVKHLSFHCYIRKLTSGVDRGKFAYLEDLSCRIKAGCTDHPPWPAGICTKCQPSAITLARQSYRHVDNVMFEDKEIVSRFLDGWRRSGMQRVGFLYGNYEEFSDVPLGIRAVVSAIYEPPQISSRFSVELLEDPLEKDVEEIASLLGLRRVGWVFTDLEAEEGEFVAYKRSIHTHLLSAEECIMAADFQNQHPNPCRLSPSGYFGSKFVTICISGNESKQVHLSGYQVSNQCMALVRDNCLVPCLDAHELGFVRESTPEQYVPDVFYKTKGEYGGDITKLARPLPLEYLIIELTTTTPVRPKPYLVGGKDLPFPIENRQAIGQPHQDFQALSTYWYKQTGGDFLSAMSDFHLLLFLFTSDVVNLRSHLPELCQAIRERNRTMAEKWKRREWWATVEQLILASAPSPTSNPLNAPVFPVPSSSSGGWACKHCTLVNAPHLTECNACNLPRE